METIDKIKGYQFTTNFLVLLVKGCDLVIGIQWLFSLGSIMWNFSSLTLQFQASLLTDHMTTAYLCRMRNKW
ncbi:Integrase, catalytic core [Gossypium australe]|uniref:Integrase, catalytic core n=1 Tax=Gossypium australe TaxID=47621 RepID=A0A5B6WFH2_9ROSI|nr:Integrase, catalytic core [Gossypium australe]